MSPGAEAAEGTAAAGAPEEGAEGPTPSRFRRVQMLSMAAPDEEAFGEGGGEPPEVLFGSTTQEAGASKPAAMADCSEAPGRNAHCERSSLG